MELPVEGYPISDEAVTGWFQRRYGRLPGALEVGWIMDAMAQREATPPIEGPLPESVITSEPATGRGEIPPRSRQRSLPVGAALLAGVGVLALVIGGIAGDVWILHRWDGGQAVRPEAALVDQNATAPSPGQAATALAPARVGRVDVSPDRPTNPAMAQSDGPLQTKPPPVSPSTSGHPQSSLPEAARPPAAQGPAAQPATTEQQAVASPSMTESSSVQERASEQTAAVRTPATQPTEQQASASQPGMSQFSPSPSEDSVEGQAGQPKPSSPWPVGPDKIIRVQQALHSRGLYRGPIDGLIGPKTEAAVRAFQRTAGLAENGRIDTTTLSRLLGGAA